MNKKGLLLILSTAFISGFSIFINKYAIAIANPYVFTFAKNVMVALILGCVLLSWKNHSAISQLTKKQWFSLVIIGLVGGSIPFLLFFKGLTMTSAAEASFIQKSMFIFVAAMAVFFLKEKINKIFMFGALLLFLGNFLAIKSLHLSFGYGDLLIFMAVLLWSVENILSKAALNKLDSRIVAWGRMFFGSIFILIFLLISRQSHYIIAFNMKQFGWIVVTSIFLFFYVITWYSGLKSIPVSVATSILVLGAPITTVLSAISLGKINMADVYPSLLIILGLLTIIGSDYVARKIKHTKNFYVRS